MVPAYNEGRGLTTFLPQYDEVLRKICQRYELIFVDDGSTDDTAQIVKELQKNHPNLRLLSYSPNQGYAHAIIQGIKASTMDWVAYTDADGQLDLEDLTKLWEKAGPQTMVVGYRVHRQDPWIRKLASRVYNILQRLFFGISAKDINCALKLFPGKVRQWEFHSRHFLIDAEFFLLAKKHHFRVVQVPVRHLPRQMGTSTIRLSTVFETLKDMWDLWKKY